MIFTVISTIVLISYAMLILAITIGWRRLRSFKNPGLLPEVKVGVIVAVRNEAANVKQLLTSLLAQDYPLHLLEIIIVDDNSTDTTLQLVNEFIIQKKETQKLKLISLSEKDCSGKKAAINQGILASGSELIVIADADCTAESHWIQTVAAYYSEYRPQMILGPVRMADNGNFFGKLQSLEFMSLISSAAGSCTAGFPILANGANIAFTRSAYESCGGFSGNLNFPSGDDMFLMMSIKRMFGAEAIRFLRSHEAIVSTPAALSFKSFVQQRLRWVSKSRGYTDTMLISASILVFLANGCLVLSGFTALVIPGYLKLFLGLYFFKMIIDLPLLLSYSRFQKSRSLVIFFPLMELLNAVYTFLIGIAGNMGKYEWKGRKVSNKGMVRG